MTRSRGREPAVAVGDAGPCSLDDLVDEIQALRPALTRLLISRADRRLHGADGPPGLSRAQHLALSELACGPMTITELGRKTGVTLGTATRMAQRLEALGLAQRSESGATDRRIHRVGITQLGLGALRTESEAQRARLRGLLRSITPRERHELMRGLTVLTAALHEEALRGSPTHFAAIGDRTRAGPG